MGQNTGTSVAFVTVQHSDSSVPREAASQNLNSGTLRVKEMGRGYAWLDTGTPDSLLEAAEFVATLERRQGMKIACPEEIAWRQTFIDDAGLERAAARLGKSAYAVYLKSLIARQ